MISSFWATILCHCLPPMISPRGLRLNCLSPGLVRETVEKRTGHKYDALVKSSGPAAPTVKAATCAALVRGLIMGHATATIVDAAPEEAPAPTSAPIGTLYGFSTSPFVRKVKMCVAALGLTTLVKEETVLTTPMDPDAHLASLNPLGKIPCFVVHAPDSASGAGGGQHQQQEMALYDSRVICEFLQASVLAGLSIFPEVGPTRWTALRRQALADGMCEAMVLLRY